MKEITREIMNLQKKGHEKPPKKV